MSKMQVHHPSEDKVGGIHARNEGVIYQCRAALGDVRRSHPRDVTHATSSFMHEAETTSFGRGCIILDTTCPVYEERTHHIMSGSPRFDTVQCLYCCIFCNFGLQFRSQMITKVSNESEATTASELITATFLYACLTIKAMACDDLMILDVQSMVSRCAAIDRRVVMLSYSAFLAVINSERRVVYNAELLRYQNVALNMRGDWHR
ncbi:hypothetical protein HYE67_005857 [Fusarium culmorum]|uniref:Uncharacterized protein n=1 Tax=Fusarium culmorum TaxID=5516 RepID=A0A7S8HVY6_FUSCU|nr:hypothetical protein HYE67_005857 [Fusarium culmorum]